MNQVQGRRLLKLAKHLHSLDPNTFAMLGWGQCVWGNAGRVFGRDPHEVFEDDKFHGLTEKQASALAYTFTWSGHPKKPAAYIRRLVYRQVPALKPKA